LTFYEVIKITLENDNFNAIFNDNISIKIELIMRYFHRKLLDELKKWLDRREILAIKGPRQSGKTTLLHIIKEYLIHTKRVEKGDNRVEEKPKGVFCRYRTQKLCYQKL